MEQTPEEVAKAALASLNKSASITGGRRLPANAQSQEQTPASSRLMAKLWELMTSMYGHKWTSVHGLADDDGMWGKALAGLDGKQIAKGMQACLEQKLTWPPSAPEFRGMCELVAADFGLPDDEKAYREACRNAHPCMAGITKWSHNAVYHAAVETGFYNLNTLPMAASRKLFERNYTIAVRMVMAGEPLKSMPLALPETVSARTTPEVGQSALAKIRNQLRGAQDESTE